MLEDSFSRAQSIDLLTANNPAFRRFYQAQGTAWPRSGFHITASYGMVLLPEESQDITEALQERTPELAELRRGAGSQFDPAVVALVWPSAPAPARVSGGGPR